MRRIAYAPGSHQRPTWIFTVWTCPGATRDDTGLAIVPKVQAALQAEDVVQRVAAPWQYSKEGIHAVCIKSPERTGAKYSK